MAEYLAKERRILVVIGPSGSGKSSTIQILHKQGLVEVTPSWTTRPPRQGEAEHSVEHVFVTPEKFSNKEQEGYFLKTVVLFGLPFRYGLPRIKQPAAGQIPTVMLRSPLVSMVPEFYPNTVVYQIEDTLERVKSRLGDREADGERLGTRLSKYQQEVAIGREVAKRVFVNAGMVTGVASEISTAIKEDFGLT